MHRVLTPVDYRQTAWKNGGGRTTEIAMHPPGTDYAGFAWRVSVADVARDGPFSVFEGVDRILVLLQGAGLRLAREGGALEIRAPYEPVRFAGDIAYEGSLYAGPVRDFNLMIRRRAARGDIDVVREQAGTVPPARFQLCYAAAGACECLLPAHVPIRLNEQEALYIDAEDAPPAVLRVNPLSPATVALAVAVDLAPAA